MKKTLLIVIAAAVLMLSGCASLRLSPEEKAQIAEQIQENLDNRTFLIDVDQMLPRRGGSRHVTGFSLKVDGDRLISNLPYFGQAWNVPYGGGKGLSFESDIADYIETYPKADSRQIALTTYNGEDNFLYIIEVYTNGKAVIEVRSRNRETISYYGTVSTKLEN